MMTAATPTSRLHHLSFKGNLKHTRYGWLRLTPAYSYHLLAEMVRGLQPGSDRVLDPFCGTGTTALVCAERGIDCDTTDINPFLVWLASAKTRSYSESDIIAFFQVSKRLLRQITSPTKSAGWIPPLHQIEKWWSGETLVALAKACAFIKETAGLPPGTRDLLKVAFCRTLIERAHVSFGHQSMSFKKPGTQTLALIESDAALVAQSWSAAVKDIGDAAKSAVRTPPAILLCDARDLTKRLPRGTFSAVITSPPYPNRMSYIRELRPYMYWLEFLADGRAAGELDWQAIGGTWGCATSNVGKWSPPTNREVPFDEFEEILRGVAGRSALLSRYIHKYFYDMLFHVDEICELLRPAGRVHYVVGNSKFYDVMLPVERIYAAMFKAAGLNDIDVKAIRKRSSKKELFEFVVTGSKPRQAGGA